MKVERDREKCAENQRIKQEGRKLESQ